MLQTIYNKVESVGFCLIINQSVDFVNEYLSGGLLELGVELVGEFVGVVGDDLYLEL